MHGFSLAQPLVIGWLSHRRTNDVLRFAGRLAVFFVVGTLASHVPASDLTHLRSGAEQEWDEFPVEATQRTLTEEVVASPTKAAHTIRLRQQDVKEAWEVVVNEQRIGQLIRDENDMIVYFDVEADVLKEKNSISVRPIGNHKASDDIRVGEITLLDQPRSKVLSQSRFHIHLLTGESPSPGRITILNSDGALVSLGTASSANLAVRPGTIYTASGEATVLLPAGEYELIAGRGFEYSIARKRVHLAEGERAEVTLSIRREVNTSGWIACDTHIHTLSHSGHGDATEAERMVTLAGEGVELPIATDHNRHIDYERASQALNVRKFFTPVIGNEVTTKTGHFNIFPVVSGSPVPPHQNLDWQQTFDGIFLTPGVRVAILNHARDLHSGTTPFGPEHFNEAAGEMLDEWNVGFNAMEIVNSGATKTAPLQLTQDWMTLLNRGRRITPVGSSDSHDVSRYIVGQGRTYIRCDDSRPNQIDVDRAVDAFLSGKVMVSYGLMAEMRVNQTAQSGDSITPTDDVLHVDVSVRGPDWVSADTLQLYANGLLIKEMQIDASQRSEFPEGEIFATSIELPRPNHDIHLVAVATGPGVEGLHWRTAKPYQPDSPVWTSRTLGCSGAIFVDADGDGQWQCAHQYAQRVMENAGPQLPAIVKALKPFDDAVATQVALLLNSSGVSPIALLDQELLSNASEATQRGFIAYANAWRANQLARAK